MCVQNKLPCIEGAADGKVRREAGVGGTEEGRGVGRGVAAAVPRVPLCGLEDWRLHHPEALRNEVEAVLPLRHDVVVENVVGGVGEQRLDGRKKYTSQS